MALDVRRCITFAATYPERIGGLVLYATYAKRQDPDAEYPWALGSAERQATIHRIERTWGTDEFTREWLRAR